LAGKQLNKLPHKTDKCNSRQGLAVFLREDGDIDGYCFSCGTYIRHPYGDEKDKAFVEKLVVSNTKSEEQIASEMAEVSGYPIVDVPSRKLRADLLNEFGAHTSMSEEDGTTPTAIYWPVTKDGELVAYHVKGLIKNAEGKSFVYNLGKAKDADLLNWENARSSGAYRLIITEGPEDMASVRAIYKLYGDDNYQPAIASLPAGVLSAKRVLTKHAEEIKRSFKEVVLCFDNDDPGQRAVQDVMQILPNAKNVLLPRKDANQCILDGVKKAAFNQLAFKALAPKNTRIVFAESLHEAARKPAEWGEFSWPWEGVNQATRRIRAGETIYVGAGVKMGKSEFLNELAVHNIREHDAKVFMAKPEEANNKTYKLLAGKMVNRVFHDPKRDFDYDAFDKAGKMLSGRVSMLNLYQHLGWESLRSDIIAAAEWGAKLHFIDPITNLTNGISASDANTALQGFAQEISSLSLDLGISTFMFCHLKAPDGNISRDQRLGYYKSDKFIGLGNCPHELGGDVSSSQFAGSRAMMRSCNYMFALEGNKDPDLTEEVRNIRNLRLLEDREFGEVGTFPLYWSRETTHFTEI
jgi:twinkle protein